MNPSGGFYVKQGQRSRNGDPGHAGKIPKRRFRRPVMMVFDGLIAGIIGVMSVFTAEELESV